MLEQSTTIRGTLPAPPAATPSVPNSTCSRSAPVLTIVNSTSVPARSTGRATSLAPSAASGSAFARVRFQTWSAWPAFSSRSAIG